MLNLKYTLNTNLKNFQKKLFSTNFNNNKLASSTNTVKLNSSQVESANDSITKNLIYRNPNK